MADDERWTNPCGAMTMSSAAEEPIDKVIKDVITVATRAITQAIDAKRTLVETGFRNCYEYLQYFAVGLEQMKKDEVEHNNGLHSELFSNVEHRMILVLCELQIGLQTLNVKYHEIHREVMHDKYRNVEDDKHRHMRDFLIMRDYVIVMAYISELFFYLQKFIYHTD